MAPVEQPLPRGGNPDASLLAHRGRRQAGGPAQLRVADICACVRRARCARVASPGSAAPPGVGRLHAPGGCSFARSTGCHDHSGCTTPPACGSARTGTCGLSPFGFPDGAECAGRTRPGAPHCAGTAFTGTCRARRGRQSLAGKRDRCRSRLLRLGCVVHARDRRAPNTQPPISAALPFPPAVDKSPAHRTSLWTAPSGYVTCPQLPDACLRPDALRLPTSRLKEKQQSRKWSAGNRRLAVKE